MNEFDLCRIIDAMEASSIGRDDTFISDNQDAFDRYMGEPYGDEEPNRSSVVTTDVFDVVDSDMVSNTRVFLGSNEIVEFIPKSEREDDIKEAEEKNTYIPYVLTNCRNSYKKQSDFLKSIEIYKAGVLEYGIRESKTAEKKKWKALNELEVAAYLQDFEESADIKEVKVTSQESYKEEGEELFNLEVSLIREKREFFIENVPIEDLILSRGVQTKDDAEVVGKRWSKTKGELIREGFDKEVVKGLAQSKSDLNSQMKQARFSGQGGDTHNAGQLLTGANVELHWTQEIVSGVDVYVMVDYDEDGVTEIRHVIKSGKTLLLNEDFDHRPYVICSASQIPHSLIGRSRAELAMPTQRVQTVLSRATLNNVYMVNAGRNVISEKVNTDDMLLVRENGVVRYRGDDPISNHVMPLITPYVGDKTLQIIQYFDSRRAQTTGSLMANQGLEADDLHKETATRFNGIEDASKGKVELLIRNIAEIGYVQLYEGLAWFANHYQDDEQEYYVLGKQLTTNPSKWRYEHYIESAVGEGAGDGEKALQNHSAYLALQEQLKVRGSMLVDEKKIYNSMKKIAKIIGIKDTTAFVNDPEIPEQLLLAQNEQLQAMVMQMEQMLQMSQNPLAEVENIKAMKEMTLKAEQMKQDMAKWSEEFREKQRQFDVKTAQAARQHTTKTAVDLTKLELDENNREADVPGALT
jgi:hypothetical protein